MKARSITDQQQAGYTTAIDLSYINQRLIYALSGGVYIHLIMPLEFREFDILEEVYGTGLKRWIAGFRVMTK